MRYIDADKLCEALKSMASVQESYKQNTILGVVSSVENFPTADVVPKSEADEIAEELSDTIVMKDELFDEVIKLRGELANAKAEVAREIFEEIETCMKNFEDDDDGYLLKKCEFEFFMRELKKKHTEEKK